MCVRLVVDRDTYRLINLPGASRNVGVEALATLRKAPFAATLSYTWVRSRENGEATPLTPQQSFGATAMYEKGDWRFGAESYFTGEQRLEQNPYRTHSAAYVVFGLLGERKLGPARLFVNAENLGNVRQTHWDPLLRHTRAADGRWTVDAWAPLDGRVINGGLRFRW